MAICLRAQFFLPSSFSPPLNRAASEMSSFHLAQRLSVRPVLFRAWFLPAPASRARERSCLLMLKRPRPAVLAVAFFFRPQPFFWTFPHVLLSDTLHRGVAARAFSSPHVVHLVTFFGCGPLTRAPFPLFFVMMIVVPVFQLLQAGFSALFSRRTIFVESLYLPSPSTPFSPVFRRAYCSWQVFLCLPDIHPDRPLVRTSLQFERVFRRPLTQSPSIKVFGRALFFQIIPSSLSGGFC